jgi:hypothetical protein
MEKSEQLFISHGFLLSCSDAIPSHARMYYYK